MREWQIPQQHTVPLICDQCARQFPGVADVGQEDRLRIADFSVTFVTCAHHIPLPTPDDQLRSIPSPTQTACRPPEQGDLPRDGPRHARSLC